MVSRLDLLIGMILSNVTGIIPIKKKDVAAMVRNKWFFLVPFIILFIVFGIIGLAHVFAPSWIGEKLATAGYMRKTTAELFYSSIENAVILAVGFSWGKRRWRREHEEFDREHGVVHDDTDVLA